MQVDIYIKESEGSRELRIPWLPDRVRCDVNGTRMESFEIIDEGEVDVPSGSNLTRFSWESIFPGEGHKDLPFLRGKWQNPKKIQTMLSEWRVYGTPLRIIVTGTPINHDVYLEDYSVDYESGYGDYKYAISFKQRKKIKISSKKAHVSRSVSFGSSHGGGGGGGHTYTVKQGDTLWGISQKYYGAGSQYGTIYNANKDGIESTAQKYGKSSSNGGHWIYPGQVIHIP